jgi:hypothetical protein
MALGTMLRPAGPSGPVPTNRSLLDDVRLFTPDAVATPAQKFVPDRNSTILIEAAAVVQKVGDDTLYKSVQRSAVARTSAAGAIAISEGPTLTIGTLGILTITFVNPPASDRIEVTVTGIALTNLNWQVAVAIFQMDQSG